MNLRKLVLPLALALTMSGCASLYGKDARASDAPRALPESGPVSVAWADPETFGELKYSGNRWASSQGNWLRELAEHMREEAEEQLPSGHHLDLTIVDLQRAGRYEPWQRMAMQDVRIVRDIYPPRMTVQFRHTDAEGNLIAEGERKLSDPAFLTGMSPINDTDTLRYEKRMVDSWLRREFRDPTASR